MTGGGGPGREGSRLSAAEDEDGQRRCRRRWPACTRAHVSAVWMEMDDVVGPTC